jgi:hypothetical protein
MQIGQSNIEDVILKNININGTVQIFEIDMTLSMRIPKDGLLLNYLSPITQSH